LMPTRLIPCTEHSNTDQGRCSSIPTHPRASPL
jgi:hypothetical protein